MGDRAGSTPLEEKPGSTTLLQTVWRAEGSSRLSAPEHHVDPIHVHGHPGEEIGELERSTFPDHEGVDSVEKAITDQRAAGVSLRQKRDQSPS